jgi:hypothetical protein
MYMESLFPINLDRQISLVWLQLVKLAASWILLWEAGAILGRKLLSAASLGPRSLRVSCVQFWLVFRFLDAENHVELLSGDASGPHEEFEPGTDLESNVGHQPGQISLRTMYRQRRR